MTTITTSPYSVISTKKKLSRNGKNNSAAAKTTTTTTTIQVKVGNQMINCPMTTDEAAVYIKTFQSSALPHMNKSTSSSSSSMKNNNATTTTTTMMSGSYYSGDMQMILDHDMPPTVSYNNNNKKKTPSMTMKSPPVLPVVPSHHAQPTPAAASSVLVPSNTAAAAASTNFQQQQQQMLMSAALPFPVPMTTPQSMMDMNQMYADYCSMAAGSAAFPTNGTNRNGTNASTTTTMPNGMPCSEKEMKALMSMFVEIMSLQMNTDRLNQSGSGSGGTTGSYPPTVTQSNKKKKATSSSSNNNNNTNSSSLFQFPTDVPPPPQGWPECLTWPPVYELRGGKNNSKNSHSNDNNNNEEDDSIDSLPGLESIPVEDRPRMIQYAEEARSTKAALLAATTTAAMVRNGMYNHMSAATSSVPITERPFVPMPPVPGCTVPILDVTGPVTGAAGIVPMEWSMIEHTAIEDALEQEELLSMRLRKQKSMNNSNNYATDSGNYSYSNKKMTSGKKKKQQQQQMFPAPNLPPELASRTATSITSQEATIALQKVEEANRKLGKAVTMWRNRVMTAVTQNEISKLELLLHESPLRTVTHMQQQAASVLSFHNNMSMNNSSNAAATMFGQGMNGVETVDDHLRYLVPLTIPKNFASMKSNHGSNSVARILLAQYIISEFSPNHFVIPGQNGRSVLHMACMMADISILKLILEHAKQTLHPTIVCEVLMKRCHDSGWNAFHYAISSGSLRIIEAILQSLAGENELIQKMITSTTNDTLTWKRGETVGVSPQFLACSLLSYHPETRIETHGMALQEIVNHRIRNKTIGNHATIDPTWYVAYLTQIAICLTLIQANGHVALDEAEIARIERDTIKQMEESQILERNNTAAAAAAAMASSSSSSNYNSTDAMMNVDDDDKWMDCDDEIAPTTTVEKKVTKSKKKKKKNKQPLPNSSATTVSAATSPSDIDETDHNNPDAEPSVDRDVTSIEESETSKPSATVVTETSTDPLVTALMGMGFEYSAIMDGIKACGGTSHATADDIVAWIFGGGSDHTNSNHPAESLNNNNDATQQSSSEPPMVSAVAPPKSSDSYKENVKRVEALREKEEEERIAVEKLAAKREEQRRRNREWNSRAQARQIQETEDKIAKAAAASNVSGATATAVTATTIPNPTIRAGAMATPTSILQHNSNAGTPGGLRGGLSPSNAPVGFDPSAIAATPSRMATSAANRTAGRLNLGPSAAETYYDNGYGNDGGSTMASSVDHGIIDIGGNDDATVSTIGSFPAVYPPAPASYAPPGFSNGPILPTMDSGGSGGHHQPQYRGITQAQWEAHRSLAMSDSYALNNNGPYSSMGIGGLGITSMIPESSPVQNHHRNYYDDMQTPSLNLPSQSNTLPSAFGSFSGTSADFAPGNSSLFGGGSTALMRNDGYNNDPLGYSLRSNPLERSLSAHSTSSFLNDTNPHNIPGLFGFGSDMNQKALDSTIIDSISTGNTGIGGSALWGNSTGPESYPGGGGGGGTTSLLENLILNSTSTTTAAPTTDYQQQQQQRDSSLFPTTSSNELESQFPETSFLSKDAISWDRTRLSTNNLRSSQEGANGSSIW